MGQMIETAMAVDAAELAKLVPSVSWAFGGSEPRTHLWLSTAGLEHIRVARLGGVIVGGLVEIPMGQWFGGSSVSALGIAGVAIAPEARGRGVALELLRSALAAARARGVALSSLYPSTFSLYRKAGYELAGSHCRFTLQLRQLARARRPLEVMSLNPDRQTEIGALYREVARLRNGYLDRGPYVWNRVRQPHQEAARAFGVAGPRGLCGYAFLRPGSSHVPFELLLSDFITTGVEAFESLLAFLADHRTTADRATWHGSPVDARLLGVPELVIQSKVDDYWMLRLVDVRAALLGRGYPPVDATVAFQVADELLPENSGQHCLRVRAGVPEVESRGSGPSVRLGVGALAALYTGFASPWELRLAGKLEADDAVLATLGLLFAGAAPGMSDYF